MKPVEGIYAKVWLWMGQNLGPKLTDCDIAGLVSFAFISHLKIA